MSPTHLQTLAAWAQGTLVQGSPDQRADAVCTDTRKIAPGCLFVALAGERFDAHEFVSTAAAQGAAAVLVSRPVTVPEGTGVILTDDTLTGLQRIAAAWRKTWGGIVVGLTGSNGKTSTKDLTTAVLSLRFPVNATAGNLNNHIGLPLTVLACQPEHRLAVCEMGMNHPGEIAPLAAIAAPDVAIITNVGTAHIEYMGSRDAIAVEKGELAAAVHAGGCVILNANDDFTPVIAARCKAPVLTAGIDAGDVRVTGVQSGPDGCRFQLHLPDGQSGPVHLPVPGRHMAGNAALAAAAGWHFGLRLPEITAGLEASSLTKGRLQMRQAAGLTILDDSYNANPDSMTAALETLAGFPCAGRRIAVLGRMGERGDHALADHRRTGADVQRCGIDLLFTVGPDDAPEIVRGFLAAGGSATAATAFPDHAACVAHLRSLARPDDLILLKGSRSTGMEKIADLLAN